MKYSVVIPCYNEEKRILPVIKTVRQSGLFNQIIVVDDGSKNSTKKILQKIKNITLITHDHNQGKAQALKSGLLRAANDIVVFLDSDLKNLTQQHLIDLTNPLLSGTYDMVIGDPYGVWWPFVALGYSANISGQRAFIRRTLLRHLEIFDHHGYLNGYFVEPSINHIYYRRYQTAKVRLKNLSNYYKINKFGLKGLIYDLRAFYRFFKFLGPKEYFFQLNFIRCQKYLNA